MAPKIRTNVRLVDACDKYLARIEAEGQSRSSIYTANHALTRFQRTVATRRDPNPLLHLISPETMDDYCYGESGLRSGREGKPIAAVTFNRYRSVLVNFFNYAVVMRWIDVSPMDGIRRARPDAQKVRLLLSAGEMIQMLEQAANPVERVALSIGMNTGLRANDIRHLTIFDANLSSGVLQSEIRKTRKFDEKPITMDLHRELVRFLDWYAHRLGLDSRSELPNDALLVPTYRNAAPREADREVHLRPYAMHTHPWRLVQRPLAQLGYPTKGEGFHTLRRSSARAFFESLRQSGEGRDHALMIVKDFLNHSSTAITEHYLGLSQERTIRDTLLKDKSFLTSFAQVEHSRVAPEGKVRQLG